VIYLALVPLAVLAGWMIYELVTPGPVQFGRRLARGQREETPVLALVVVGTIVGLAVILALGLTLIFRFVLG
jgi:hypothetical protein